MLITKKCVCVQKFPDHVFDDVVVWCCLCPFVCRVSFAMLVLLLMFFHVVAFISGNGCLALDVGWMFLLIVVRNIILLLCCYWYLAFKIFESRLTLVRSCLYFPDAR